MKMYLCIRPYHVENTSSRPITEVKQHWAALVLGWVTAWEYAVLYSLLPSPDIQSEFLNESSKSIVKQNNKLIYAYNGHYFNVFTFQLTSTLCYQNSSDLWYALSNLPTSLLAH